MTGARLRSRSLGEGWTLHVGPTRDRVPPHLLAALIDGVPATVPGCAMTDLMAAGLVSDPRRGDAEAGARWVGWTDWEYRRPVEVDSLVPGARVHLQFDGLDTVAEILWDTQTLATTRNMHRRYDIDLTERATPGRHELVVRFQAPEVAALQAQEEQGGPLPNSYGRPYEALRKMACTFGWDWGPDFPSTGMWRPVRLVEWSGARLGDVRVDTRRDAAGTWHLEALVEVEAQQPCRLTTTVAGARVERDLTAGRHEVTLSTPVRGVTPWRPHTHGSPQLYPLEVTVRAEDDAVLDTTARRVGFREIGLDTGEDEIGQAFTLLLDGRPVQVRGVNWIPPTCFPGSVTREELAARLGDAVDVGANLVRVWGGGAYESEDFYDLCDELGLLVWQDFAFACAAYSEDPRMWAEVEAEARDNVARLQHRPSLVLWCGNNENIWAFEEWGWADELAGRAWGEGYYRDLLPRLVAELDPRRPYWPGSPFGGDGVAANDERYGCTHVWDVWNDVDHEVYLDHAPRFVSEFGYQGPPAYSTMRDCVGPEHLHVDDPVLAAHQKAEDGQAHLERGLTSHDGATGDLDDWWWRTQRIQAEALRLGVEHFRTLGERCSGFIWWQLDDCWPVQSWSLVDSAGVRKPAWFAMRSACRDRLLGVTGRTPRVVAVNDTDEPWRETLTLDSYRLGDGVWETRQVTLDAPARSTVEVASGLDPDLLWRARGTEATSATWRPADVYDQLPAPDLAAAATPTADGWEVRLHAHSPALDVCLFVDRLDSRATVEDQLFSLWPGEEATLRVSGAQHVAPDALTSHPVLRCLGDRPRTG